MEAASFAIAVFWPFCEEFKILGMVNVAITPRIARATNNSASVNPVVAQGDLRANGFRKRASNAILNGFKLFLNDAIQ
jgi:hypothetical protein